MGTEPAGDGPTQRNAPESVARPARFSLYFVYPRDVSGVVIELTDGLTVGRDATLPPAQDAQRSNAGAHLAIPHPTVSRRHARIQNSFGVPFLNDLGSSNGTRVNGSNIAESTALTAQSVVRFGDAFAVVDTHPSTELPAGTDALPGRSPLLGRVREVLKRAAPQLAPVLISGETGTGKESVAAEVHRVSGRSGPFIKLSCAELSPQLIESQLFGHERGAFTGADARHAGLFVAAQHGTLFLDEIGELPLESQAKLLRVLQEREVRAVGSLRTQTVDVRVVTATNHDLAAAVEEGRFRRDLHARLAIFELKLPALRERRQDLMSWLDWLAQTTAGQATNLEWHPAVVERILLHGWPDNLRGLARLVQRMLALGGGTTIGMQLLRDHMPELSADVRPSVSPNQLASGDLLDEQGLTATDRRSSPPSKEEFLSVYEAMGRNVRAISKHFGRDRRQIYRWLEAFGIER